MHGLSYSNRKITTNMTKNKIVSPPLAARKKQELVKHGHTRIDHYFWLREKENSEVVDYLKAENEYTQQEMAATMPLQEKLYNEIVGRIKETDESVPYKKDDYFYYTKQVEGKNYPIHCRKYQTLEAEEQIVADVNILAEGRDFIRFTPFNYSLNQQLLAYGVDYNGDRVKTLHIKNLATGELLTDAIDNVVQASWAADNQRIYYSIYDHAKRPYKIMCHVVGTPSSEDTLIYHETDQRFSCVVYRSLSKEYMYIHTGSQITNEMLYFDARENNAKPVVIQARKEKHQYYVEDAGEVFYIRSNWNAPNFSLYQAPKDSTQIERWQQLIPNRNDILLDDFAVFKNYMVIEERINGLANLRVLSYDKQLDYHIPFKDPAFVSYAVNNYNYDTDTLRFAYSSLTQNFSIYEINMRTKEQQLLKQYEVLGGYNANDYQSERIMVPVSDTVKVPVSLVYKKELFKKDGSNPMLLYGYGSYGINVNPSFRSSIVSLLDRGFVYAVAHIRGSETLGRHWYENGKFLRKKNTFQDFIDSADYLVANGYTAHNKLVIEGGSAGGLLMGAVVNMRPDLCAIAMAHVPFVDVVSTMLDEDLPLTIGEYEEWGNPNDKTYYDYMLSYSPYDNVEAKDYPNIMVITGFHDSQVHYWEPAKWVAKLRHLKTDNNKLLFKINMEVGHSGASGRYEKYKDVAFEYAFILTTLGVEN